MAHTKQARDLGPAERAVYRMVQLGEISVVHAPLYRRQIGALGARGLIGRVGDKYVDTAALPAHAPAYRPAAVPAPKRATPPMGTLVVRVPPDVLAALDATGVSRSEAARAALLEGLTRPAAGTPAGASPSGTRRRIG